VADINHFMIISSYLFFVESGIWKHHIGKWHVVLYFFLKKEQPDEKGVLFGYPIASKKKRWDNGKR
jgi:hypothetical protein